MRSFALTVFRADEILLLQQAVTIVDCLPHDDTHTKLRCHEVARIVGTILRLDVIDGHYGAVDHSWCLTPRKRILDPYCVGRLPQVQLVDPHVFTKPLYDLTRLPGGMGVIDEAFVGQMVAYVLTKQGRS